MNTNQMIGVALVCLFAAIAAAAYRSRKEARQAKKIQRLWETGATRLLAKVWGLSNDPQPGMPDFEESAWKTREKISNHIKAADRADTSFEHEVCGEMVSVVLKRPNTLFGFVEKEETFRAIEEAHDMMSNPEQQLYVGIFPLTLDIRVTDPAQV